jgi:protein SCO1/2
VSEGRPAGSLRWIVWGVLAVVLLTVLVAAVLHYAPPTMVSSAPPSIRPVGGFALINQDGAVVTVDELAGRVWVADFIFTRCTSSCPLMTAAMKQLRDRWPANLPVRFVSISVDPGYDRPPVLRRYMQRHGIRGEDWIFLTGEPAAIRRIARDIFLLPIESHPPPGVAQPVVHSTRFVLVDAKNTIRGYYDGLDKSEIRRLLEDAKAVGHE